MDENYWPHEPEYIVREVPTGRAVQYVIDAHNHREQAEHDARQTT
jgi:hypothetical protein